MTLRHLIPLIALGLILAGPAARAGETRDELSPSTTKGPYYDHSENELRTRKFFRGLANVGLCVAEIPNQAFREAHKTSPVTGVVVGTAKGVWKGAKRLVIGVWEMATFYAPMKNKYQPYIEPEVVFMEDLH
jgi:putative exosortase-associated protein (TIGR04073 family)